MSPEPGKCAGPFLLGKKFLVYRGIETNKYNDNQRIKGGIQNKRDRTIKKCPQTPVAVRTIGISNYPQFLRVKAGVYPQILRVILSQTELASNRKEFLAYLRGIETGLFFVEV